ncbi:MAG: penicillin-binding protein 2 [Candidatus Absconditabacteria bacterium]
MKGKSKFNKFGGFYHSKKKSTNLILSKYKEYLKNISILKTQFRYKILSINRKIGFGNRIGKKGGKSNTNPYIQKINNSVGGFFSKLDNTFAKFIPKTNFTRETKLIIFFLFLFSLLFSRLFRLQVIKSEHYSKILSSQHYSKSLLKAKRGNIYVMDKAGKEQKLTENILLYNIYVDPKFVNRKPQVIEKLTPLLYKHFCELNGLSKPDKEECIKNIEKFSGKKIFPEDKKLFYLSGTTVEGYVDEGEYTQAREKVLTDFGTGSAYQYITDTLDELIKTGKRDRNYFGFFDNDVLINQLTEADFPFVNVVGNYIYIVPNKVYDENSATRQLKKIFDENGYNYSESDLKSYMREKDLRYVKLASGLNSQIAKELKDMKEKLYSDKYLSIPLLHGVGLEEYERRIYPYGEFMANLIGYVDKNGKSFYGIEEYYDEMLKGKDGKIAGASVPWIGTIGSNNVSIQKPEDGVDLFLTIDPTMQKKLEDIVSLYYNILRPDSISMVVMDPFNGKVRGMVNYPSFDPNFYEDIYKIKPLKYEDRYIVDDDSFIDYPVLVLKDDKLKEATYDERKDNSTKKYIYKNLLGPQVFVDKNIASPYEPGSIFKAFTLAIGIDTDEINMFDKYQDNMSVQVGPFRIGNIHKECEGYNTYLNSLEWSCNVGMVRIAQKIQRYAFYSYLQKFGFGSLTNIELAGEKSGDISALNQFSMARFFNNAFGQGILATPLQVAVGYSALVNGGYMVKPTIVEKIYNYKTNDYVSTEKKVLNRVLKSETSEDIKTALWRVVSEGDLKSTLDTQDYTLGGKTGTSQVVFKGKYQSGAGWINGSFVGIVTKDDLRYVVAIQVRRPRTCPWGLCSAGNIFKETAPFLIEYDGIK